MSGFQPGDSVRLNSALPIGGDVVSVDGQQVTVEWADGITSAVRDDQLKLKMIPTRPEWSEVTESNLREELREARDDLAQYKASTEVAQGLYEETFNRIRGELDAMTVQRDRWHQRAWRAMGRRDQYWAWWAEARADVRQLIADGDELEAERDRARDLAVRLEQELASAELSVRSWRGFADYLSRERS